MKPCPNCQQPVTPGTLFCPNCGADTRSLWTTPAGSGLAQMDMMDFTARRRSDKLSRFLGFLTGFLVGTFTFPIGFLILLFLWLFPSRSNPYFARGIKSGAITVVVLFMLLILGAFLICFRMPH